LITVLAKHANQIIILEKKLNTPDLLKYNQMDEWVKVEAEIATIGISDYAQEQLSDIVFVEIQVSVGETIEKGREIAVVESVKASADIGSPVSGKVLEINSELLSSPELLNSDPYGQAWLIKVEMSNPGELTNLMDFEAYLKYRKI
jgi:glycine cleavage system H protein